MSRKQYLHYVTVKYLEPCGNKRVTEWRIQAVSRTAALLKAVERCRAEGKETVTNMFIAGDIIPKDKRERRRALKEKQQRHKERHTWTYDGVTRID